ncbi:MAG: hypothetical protein H0V21_04410 [Rubrobacter sp.]|nr:hypothetical protein [Rubrobacter sp.]
MASWGRVVAGVVIGVAGTIYATNEDVRKKLPRAARDLPDNFRSRYKRAVSAAREASERRREEILHDLEEHGGGHHTARGAPPDPDAGEVAHDTPNEQPTEVSEEVTEQR